MLKQILFSMLVFSIATSVSFGQSNTDNTASLKAHVKDIDGKPIEVGNALILSNLDSSLIKGDLFLDGQILIHEISQHRFLLKISALGFEEYLTPIVYDSNKASSQSTLDLGDIILSYDLSNVIEIKSKTQIVEQRGSDLIVNVANTALKNAGTGGDVIRNAPKVFFDRTGQANIFGKGKAVIYLNGQRLTSPQLLESLSSTDIKHIEIIENPSAKYDSEGAAVIDIITKVKTIEGYKIGLVQSAAKGKYYRSRFQADSYVRSGKFYLQGNYSLRPWKWGARNGQTRTTLSTIPAGIFDNLLVQKNKRIDHSYDVHSNYQIAKNTKIGLQYTGTSNTGRRQATNLRTGIRNQENFLNIESDIIGFSHQKSNILNSYFQSDLDTLGSNVKGFVQYANYSFTRDQDNMQTYTSENLLQNIERNTKNLSGIYILTFQLDFLKQFSNTVSLESGVKNARISNSGQLTSIDKDELGNTNTLPQFSNSFNYNENILAAYTQLKWEHNSWSFSAGLRAERTSFEIESQENPRNDDYFNIFPSVSLQKNFSDKLNTTLSYSNRIGRPLYQDLNPYIIYVDSLVSLRGNPDLVPEFSHNFSGQVNFNGWNLGLSYVYTKDKINQLFRSVDPTNRDIIAFRKENLKHTKLYSASLSKYLNYKWYSANTTIGGFYDDHQIKDVSQVLINNKVGYYLQFFQSFQLPASISLNTNLNYTSPRVDGVYTDNSVSYLNASISKNFFEGRMKLTLWANDIFDKYKWIGDANFNDMHMTYLSEGDYRFFRVILNWNFGKMGQNPFGDRKVSQSEINRVNSI